MNAEDRDYLSLIEARNDPDTDKRWLIERLEAEMGELAGIDLLLERRDALDDCKTRYDKIAKTLAFVRRAEAAEAERDKLQTENERYFHTWTGMGRQIYEAESEDRGSIAPVSESPENRAIKRAEAAEADRDKLREYSEEQEGIIKELQYEKQKVETDCAALRAEVERLQKVLAAATRAMFHSPIVTADFEAQLHVLGIDTALAASAPPSESQECICVNEATSRNCPVHGKFYSGSPEKPEFETPYALKCRLDAAEAERDKLRAEVKRLRGLRELQAEQVPWVKHNFGDRPSWMPLLGAVEELGELAHAHLKEAQGIRVSENHRENAKDAVADIIIYLADYASAVGFDLQSTVMETWDRVKKRDWKKNPADAASAPPGEPSTGVPSVSAEADHAG